jgi:uncharacterized protein
MKSSPLADSCLDVQIEGLWKIIQQSDRVLAILERTETLDLPHWYLGAGAVTQTVWNHVHGFDTSRGIKDYDLVYFNGDDLSAESEAEVEGRVAACFDDLDVNLDLTNEARVHLWYQERFGRSIAPYESTEEAISTWPTTASCLGIRLEGDGLKVCAPYGLRDLFDLVVRPNKALIDREIYEAKASRWAEQWPGLTVHSW